MLPEPLSSLEFVGLTQTVSFMEKNHAGQLVKKKKKKKGIKVANFSSRQLVKKWQCKREIVNTLTRVISLNK